MPKPHGRRELANWDWDRDKYTRKQASRGRRYDGRDGIRNYLKGLWRRASKHMSL